MATELRCIPQNVALSQRIPHQADSTHLILWVYCHTDVKQSFPFLIIIGIYERYLAQSQIWRDSTEQSFYSRLTRNMKKLPLFDLLGTGSADIYEAIFDVEVSQEADLFADSDDEQQRTHIIAPASGDTLLSFPSRNSLQPLPSSPTRPSASRLSNTADPETSRHRRRTSLPRSPPLGRSRSRREGPSPSVSPRPRKITLPAMVGSSSGELQTAGQRSPLSKLYSTRGNGSAAQMERVSSAAAGMDAGVRKLEAMIEDVRSLPVNKLKDEMKELQVRRQSFRIISGPCSEGLDCRRIVKLG